MVEDSPESYRCRFCNSTFSDDILKKIEDEKDDVYCEICGDIIKRVQNKYSFNPPDISENKPKTNIDNTPVTPQKELKQNPDALNFPIGRIFYDTDFPLIFKSNFVIVFSRLVCFAAMRLEQEGEIDLGESEIPEKVMNDLYMSTRHIQDKRINAEFLINLRKISKEEFESNLKKLQTKIQSSRQYLEDFHVYTRWLIRKVYLIISDGLNKDELSKFDLTIFNDLKKSKSITHYKLKLTENNILTQFEKPRNLVNHYFKEYGKCSFNRKLTKNRHNYVLQNSHIIVCQDCKKVLKIDDFSERFLRKNSRYLKKLERSKNFGDLTIYRIYFTRSLATGKKEWLSFPGIGYVGQTIETAKERLYSGHIKNAFDVKKKHTYFENSIKKNFIMKEIAHKYIRFKILQLIRFQGDINMIRNIKNPNLKRRELEEAINSTQRLADNAEKFWIGYYKTQYKEFGRNIDEGGKENRMVLLDPAKLDESIHNNIHVRRTRSPFERVRKELDTTRAILVNSLLIYYGKSLKDISHDLILRETQKLFELGYVAKDIAIKLGLEGEIENTSKTISEWIRNEIYIERFPEKPNYRRIRDKILSEIIDQKVKEGYVTIKSLMDVLPGFEVPGETVRQKTWEMKRFIATNLGGIKKLNKKYHNKPKKDYLPDAIRIIKDYYKTKQRLSAVKLAFDLGFCQDFGYTKESLKKNAASRYIPQHTGKTMKELIELALTS